MYPHTSKVSYNFAETDWDTCLPIRVSIHRLCTENRKQNPNFHNCFDKSCFKQTRLWLVLISYFTCIYISKLVSTLTIFSFQEKERQAKKEEIIREMALAQKAKKGQKNENRLKQNFVPMPRTHDFGHKAVVSTWWLKWDCISL